MNIQVELCCEEMKNLFDYKFGINIKDRRIYATSRTDHVTIKYCPFCGDSMELDISGGE